MSTMTNTKQRLMVLQARHYNLAIRRYRSGARLAIQQLHALAAAEE